MPNIMIVDDDIHISDMLNEALAGEGYQVSRAYSGTEALLMLQTVTPDLILLDLTLPGISGEALLPRLSAYPVIVVSAKGEIAGKVGLLLGGAADYITKPFDISELLARIAVQLRMHTQPGENAALVYRALTLHPDARTVSANGQEVRLTRTEYAILKQLMQNPGQVIPKLTILEHISADTPDCTEDSLKIHVHNLRKKIRSAVGQDYISSVWGIGFMLRAES